MVLEFYVFQGQVLAKKENLSSQDYLSTEIHWLVDICRLSDTNFNGHSCSEEEGT